MVNFRNYADVTVSFTPGLNIIVGDNAQGKTNLLEALSFTATGTSPRTPSEAEVVRWNTEFTRTEMRVNLRGDEHEVSVGYAPGQRKKLAVDGVPKPSLTRFAAGEAGLKVVHFFPDDIRVIKGAPSDRREFLDGLLSSVRPGYARTVLEYGKAIQQRNQLLRRIRDGVSSRRTLETWDKKVVELGTAVLKDRIEAMDPLEVQFKDSVIALSDAESASLTCSYTALPDGYREALEGAHGADIERGATSVGPHRDDFRVLLEGVDLTTFGSQGQQRLATLALKFAARDYIRMISGEDPVLLFDDVMSELDERRREYLANYFLESPQAIISTTNMEYFDAETLNRAYVVRIQQGALLHVMK